MTARRKTILLLAGLFLASGWIGGAIWRWQLVSREAIEIVSDLRSEDRAFLSPAAPSTPEVRVPLSQFLWFPFRTDPFCLVHHADQGWIELWL